MPKTREDNAREDFMLQGHSSELSWSPRSEEEINKNLFGGSDPDKMMDAYEEQLGIKVKAVAKKNTMYKHVYLSPCSGSDEPNNDAVLLNQFYNNPDQYQVISRSDNWTPKGELKIFIEYLEDMDIRAEKEKAVKKNPKFDVENA